MYKIYVRQSIEHGLKDVTEGNVLSPKEIKKKVQHWEMKIVWTSKAEKHLSQIFDYIAKDSPYYASRTIERIISIAEKISKNPHKGRTVPEYQGGFYASLQNYLLP